MFVLLVLVISALLCFAANIPNRAENRQIRDREAALYKKAKDLEAEQAKLAATKEALKNDPMFVEYYLRKKCGLKRPGEKVYSE
jgi:cell division protein FtsB